MESAAIDAAHAVDLMRLAVDRGDKDGLCAALVAALTALADLSAMCTATTDRAVALARKVDMSWQEIGEPLRITRQAAHARFRGASNNTDRVGRKPRKEQP